MLLEYCYGTGKLYFKQNIHNFIFKDRYMEVVISKELRKYGKILN